MSQTQNSKLELLIVDGVPPGKFGCCHTAGDVMGDGRTEIIFGTSEGIYWYDSKTHERHTIVDHGEFHVSALLEDADHDGIKELFLGEMNSSDSTWMITCYKPQKDINLPWNRYVVDSKCISGAHDLLFADLDNDGTKELIVNATYGKVWGVFAYKHGNDITHEWEKHEIQTGFTEEGLAAADLNGDGNLEIISGVNYYTAPKNGPWTGIWKRTNYAPDFRELVRVSTTDINGDGQPDIVIDESEYPDGIMSWFENNIKINPKKPWVEHRMDVRLVFGHSNVSWYDKKDNTCHIFVAEMMKGGWQNPYNHDARLIEFISRDKGATWGKNVLSSGSGGTMMMFADIDNDGDKEIVAHVWGRFETMPIHSLQIWKRTNKTSPLDCFNQHILDRDKPDYSTDINITDIDGDGLSDVVTGSFWYKNPSWDRYKIPFVYQVHCAFDVDGDGKLELIATMPATGNNPDPLQKLTGELVWLKPIDVIAGKWEQYKIGEGSGGSIQSITIAPVAMTGKKAIIVTYRNKTYPEVFDIPSNPKTLWTKSTLAGINYGGQIAIVDLNADGQLEIVAGGDLLEKQGDGIFKPRTIIDPALQFKFSKEAIIDMNNDGKPDIVATETDLDLKNHHANFARICWFENPGNSTSLWKMHGIDKIRSPQSLDIADIDNDGQMEIITGENEISKPGRSSGRLLIYKKADAEGFSFYRHVVSNRAEHCNGTKVIDNGQGKHTIFSIGWDNYQYVNMWEQY